MNDDLNDLFWRTPYEVGYKKPPESGRFTKGKSGNPRGRPPKKKPDPKPLVDKSTMESFLRVASREVTAREGGNVTKISAIDAVIQTMAASAMKGSVPAQKIFVELVDRARKEQAAEISDDHEFWRSYVEKYDDRIAALLKAGKPVPEDWPHPDDIVFEDGEYVKLRGREPAIAAQNRKTMVKFRDVLMLQAEMDRRCYLKHSPGQKPPIFVSDYLSLHANSCLPIRQQLNDTEILIRIFRIKALRKIELHRRLKDEWAELGLSIPHDHTTPPIKPLLASLGVEIKDRARSKVRF